jgi:hypothetical protein
MLYFADYHMLVHQSLQAVSKNYPAFISAHTPVYLGLSFGLGSLNIAKHIKQGTGTGQVLDVIYDVKGSARNTSAIKFRDADGGVVCDMDWGVRRWTSGEMVKYALEHDAAHFP